ncbi:MAG: DUF3035 domain-containing protein [Pseudomonadota bacterium]
MILGLMAVGLAACAATDGSEGPDEFGVVPSLPLEFPESFAELPPPAPGTANRADLDPGADAAEALGGALSDPGIPAGDSGLVSFASRFGVDPDIRRELFRSDELFRARRGRLRLLSFGGGDRYFSAYARETLDARAELARFRAAGVRVPTAPPD